MVYLCTPWQWHRWTFLAGQIIIALSFFLHFGYYSPMCCSAFGRSVPIQIYLYPLTLIVWKCIYLHTFPSYLFGIHQSIMWRYIRLHDFFNLLMDCKASYRFIQELFILVASHYEWLCTWQIFIWHILAHPYTPVLLRASFILYLHLISVYYRLS